MGAKEPVIKSLPSQQTPATPAGVCTLSPGRTDAPKGGELCGSDRRKSDKVTERAAQMAKKFFEAGVMMPENYKRVIDARN